MSYTLNIPNYKTPRSSSGSYMDAYAEGRKIKADEAYRKGVTEQSKRNYELNVKKEAARKKEKSIKRSYDHTLKQIEYLRNDKTQSPEEKTQRLKDFINAPEHTDMREAYGDVDVYFNESGPQSKRKISGGKIIDSLADKMGISKDSEEYQNLEQSYNRNKQYAVSGALDMTSGETKYSDIQEVKEEGVKKVSPTNFVSILKWVSEEEGLSVDKAFKRAKEIAQDIESGEIESPIDLDEGDDTDKTPPPPEPPIMDDDIVSGRQKAQNILNKYQNKDMSEGEQMVRENEERRSLEKTQKRQDDILDIESQIDKVSDKLNSLDSMYSSDSVLKKTKEKDYLRKIKELNIRLISMNTGGKGSNTGTSSTNVAWSKVK